MMSVAERLRRGVEWKRTDPRYQMILNTSWRRLWVLACPWPPVISR
jgi:hypothetical protein